ncbi:MAG TPA: alkaline phosphatase family protein [Candidatus Binatus sp.]|nr:alkaline phosphatase family protein [Candidatus Binatus sp.]
MKALLVMAASLLLAPVYAQETPPACTFGPGALPADTLPAGTRHGSQIPVDTIVVLMQENRSFDHYFGQLHYQGKRRSEGEPRNASNPDPLGGAPISAFHQTRYCEVADLDHSWSGTHREWNNGAMDGFTAANVDANDPNGSRTMGYYDRSDFPFYYALYKKFATGDRYFCSALTQTFPNRFYLLAATSFGHIRNDFPTSPTDFAPAGGTIFERLDQAGVTWKIYYSQLAFANLFAYVRNTRQVNVVPINLYFTDAQNGTLPQVSFVDPIFLGAKNVENDEHPPANVQVGQEFASRVVKAVLTSPQWSRSAVLVTYDEHGGYYDHVPPPLACQPDGIPPALNMTDVPGDFDRLGIRVPVVAVSPYARRHFVSHKAYDHTSILRFIETRFDLGALTKRDANADPMLDLFDFRRPRFRRAPRLPDATIDQAHFDQCAMP